MAISDEMLLAWIEMAPGGDAPDAEFTRHIMREAGIPTTVLDWSGPAGREVGAAASASPPI
jgi:hypothetical protein